MAMPPACFGSPSRRPRRHIEDALQISTRALFDRIFDSADVVCLHVPNGERRDKAAAGRLKAMGTLAGTADWFLSWRGPRPPFIGWIEMKAERGRQSPEQKAFQARVTALGHHYAICRSLDDVLGVLDAWGVPKRAQVRIA